MEADGLAEPLRTFLFENVATYEQLESLLLLVEDPDEHWDAPAIASRLAIDEELAETALRHLCARGLVNEALSSFRFEPRNEKHRENATLLARTYRQSRLAVISAMNANALERVRLAGIRTFAEAFRLRGNKDHG